MSAKSTGSHASSGGWEYAPRIPLKLDQLLEWQTRSSKFPWIVCGRPIAEGFRRFPNKNYIFVSLLRFGKVPDTPIVICYRFSNSKWPLNLHRNWKHENLDFWEHDWSLKPLELPGPLKALHVVVVVVEVAWQGFFWLLKNSPPSESFFKVLRPQQNFKKHSYFF